MFGCLSVSGFSTTVQNTLIQNILTADLAYGIIYVADGLVAQGSIGTTAQVMSGFANNGPSNGITPDHVNDRLVILSDGIYIVLFQVSFSGTPNATFEVSVRVNGVEQYPGVHRKLSVGGDVGSGACVGFLNLSAGDVLTMWVESDNGLNADSFLPVDAQFGALRIGEFE